MEDRPEDFSFSKEERLLRPGDFTRARKLGKRYSTASFTVYIIPNGLDRRRLGLSVGSRVGGAVTRNRVKRLVREFFRSNKGFFPASTDILIAAKNAGSIVRYSDVEGELRGLRFTKPAPPKNG